MRSYLAQLCVFSAELISISRRGQSSRSANLRCELLSCANAAHSTFCGKRFDSGSQQKSWVGGMLVARAPLSVGALVLRPWAVRVRRISRDAYLGPK